MKSYSFYFQNVELPMLLDCMRSYDGDFDNYRWKVAMHKEKFRFSPEQGKLMYFCTIDLLSFGLCGKSYN